VFRWVPGYAGIEGNETEDQLAKDAAAPENAEELPSEEDRCISLSHLFIYLFNLVYRPSPVMAM
jgi:hypothetical protein